MSWECFVLQHLATDRCSVQVDFRVSEGALIVRALFWN